MTKKTRTVSQALQRTQNAIAANAAWHNAILAQANLPNRKVKVDVPPIRVRMSPTRRLNEQNVGHISNTPLYLTMLRNWLTINFGDDEDDEDLIDCTGSARHKLWKEMEDFLKENCGGFYYFEEDTNSSWSVMFELESDLMHFKLRFESAIL